jgi:hypothetical protein
VKNQKPNHGARLKRGAYVDQPRSFSETARELLVWQRNEFTGRVFENSGSEGKDEIRNTFVSQKGGENNPQKMVRIIDFLTSKMKIDDGGQLRKILSHSREKGSISILPTDEKLPPSEILRKLLMGEYNEKLDASQIAGRGQAYTLALYIYMHTSGDSEEEMKQVLTHLIENYDDPRMSRYDFDMKGLEVEPFLTNLCTMAIGKYKLGQFMRRKFQYALSTEASERDNISNRNARLVMSSNENI